MSEIVPVNVMVDEKGNFSLFIEQGMPLVIGADYYQLEARPDATDDLHRDIVWVAPDGAEMDVTSSIKNGAMGAALEIRDTLLPKLISGDIRVKDAEDLHKGNLA